MRGERPVAAGREGTRACRRTERPVGGHGGPAPTRWLPRCAVAPAPRAALLKRGQNVPRRTDKALL